MDYQPVITYKTSHLGGDTYEVTKTTVEKFIIQANPLQ